MCSLIYSWFGSLGTPWYDCSSLLSDDVVRAAGIPEACAGRSRGRRRRCRLFRRARCLPGTRRGRRRRACASARPTAEQPSDHVLRRGKAGGTVCQTLGVTQRMFFARKPDCQSFRQCVRHICTGNSAVSDTYCPPFHERGYGTRQKRSNSTAAASTAAGDLPAPSEKAAAEAAASKSLGLLRCEERKIRTVHQAH